MEYSSETMRSRFLGEYLFDMTYLFVQSHLVREAKGMVSKDVLKRVVRRWEAFS